MAFLLSRIIQIYFNIKLRKVYPRAMVLQTQAENYIYCIHIGSESIQIYLKTHDTILTLIIDLIIYIHRSFGLK
jgi:hypothetical protein